MKLTKKQKNYLLELGYKTNDFSQIEKACKYLKILKGEFELRTTHKDFIYSFGKYDFVRLLARAAFHRSAKYTLMLTNDFFIFDCSKFFDRD